MLQLKLIEGNISMEVDGIKFFTALEVSEKLKITPTTVRRYIRDGRLAGQKVGKTFLVSEANLFRFLKIEPKKD